MAYSAQAFRGDVFGGVTAGVVGLPVGLAFGEASGLGAVAGLYGAIAVGFFAAVFGGTRSQISGPTGPTAVAMPGLAGDDRQSELQRTGDRGRHAGRRGAVARAIPEVPAPGACRPDRGDRAQRVVAEQHPRHRRGADGSAEPAPAGTRAGAARPIRSASGDPRAARLHRQPAHVARGRLDDPHAPQPQPRAGGAGHRQRDRRSHRGHARRGRHHGHGGEHSRRRADTCFGCAAGGHPAGPRARPRTVRRVDPARRAGGHPHEGRVGHHRLAFHHPHPPRPARAPGGDAHHVLDRVPDGRFVSTVDEAREVAERLLDERAVEDAWA